MSDRRVAICASNDDGSFNCSHTRRARCRARVSEDSMGGTTAPGLRVVRRRRRRRKGSRCSQLVPTYDTWPTRTSRAARAQRHGRPAGAGVRFDFRFSTQGMMRTTLLRRMLRRCRRRRPPADRRPLAGSGAVSAPDSVAIRADIAYLASDALQGAAPAHPATTALPPTWHVAMARYACGPRPAAAARVPPLQPRRCPAAICSDFRLSPSPPRMPDCRAAWPPRTWWPCCRAAIHSCASSRW